MITMKKNMIAVAILAIITIAVPMQAFADYAGPSVQGGFTGPGPVLMTAQEAAKQKDDTWVTLRGKILNHQGDDMYTFQDSSGQGLVEIDDDAWLGQTINPQDIVELVVEVDKDWGHVELDVKTIRLAK